MNVLCIGDVVGQAGCDYLRQRLPSIKKLHSIDLTIANGENSAVGNGILPSSAKHLFDSGVDVITGGNHTFRRREVYDLLEENEYLLRPANYPDSAPGRGISYIDKGSYIVAVINILGVVYMNSLDCPFKTADRLIDEAKSNGANIIILDFHAEATSEKKALGFYLDSRVSAIFGTHTHTPTADEQILPDGTGFISDIGMTGPYLSVLGVKPEKSIAFMKDKLPVKFEQADPPCKMDVCIFEICQKSGKCMSVQRMTIKD